MRIKISNQRTCGVTLLESVVVMVLLAVLVAMLAPAFDNSRKHDRAMRISCVNNLKQIGAAFQIWEDDHADAYPMGVSTNSGGSGEYASGSEVFRHFQIMQNEMGQNPKILVCPADKERVAATNFINFNNSNLSYFIGITVTNSYENPCLLLAGDRNIGNGTGVTRGLLRLTTNDLAGWTIGLHTDAQTAAGNILLSDGSVPRLGTPGLRQALRKPGAAPTVVAVP